MRALFAALNIGLGAVGAVAPYALDVRGAGLFYLLAPPGAYALCLCFHRALGARRTHSTSARVYPPYAGLCIALVSAFLGEADINVRTGAAWAFAPVLAAALWLPALAVPALRRRGAALLAPLGIGLLLFCLVTVPYLHWVCTVQPPRAVSAVVVSTAVRPGRRGVLTRHSVTLIPEGSSEPVRLAAPGSLTDRVYRGAHVTVQQYESIFGVAYWTVTR